MSTEREFEGKDLDEALAQAGTALGVDPEKIEYAVVEEGRRGVFGIGARQVRIRVAVHPEPSPPVREEAAPKPAAAARALETEPEVEPLETPERAVGSGGGGQVPDEFRETVSRVLDLMGLEIRPTFRASGDGCTVDLDGPDRNVLVQRDGEVVSAIEFVLNRMARRAWPGLGTIHVRCDGYRNRRDDEVVELTREVAAQVARSGKPQRLHAMNPYERRLVHMTVREFPGVRSRSEGDGFLKRVTLEKTDGR